MLFIDKSIVEEEGGFDQPVNKSRKDQIKKKIIDFNISASPITVSGSLSYVQQQPWIQNMTIRNNIIFGEPYDEVKYNHAISICELERDLEILPSRDLTEIGEKGINLSGG